MASFLGKLLKRKEMSAGMPICFDALHDQARSAVASQDFESAIQLYDQAIALNPFHAEAYYKRGNVLKNLGRLHEAIESYDQAIKLKPDYAYAYCNRGVVQQTLGFIDRALSSYDQAVAHDPTDAMTYYNRALLLQECSRWDEVLQSYDRAVAIDPTFADAQFNRSLALLYCGDFERGWPSYEWRWINAQRLGLGEPREFNRPLWRGEESIAGKRVLLHSEGGLGDTLQFCRYAPLIADRGATVYLEVQEALADILANLDGVAQLIVKGNALPEFDYHCPLLSLPLACKTTLETVPIRPNYLNCNGIDLPRTHSYAQIEGRPRVGLVWSGNPNNANDRRRSVRLADWIEYLPPQFEYFRLQREVRDEDKVALEANPFIASKDEDVQDFVRIAALCKSMDIVVSVDTSLAHLSGALGQRTWILLPFVPDWRWLRDRDDSPWYPSVKLFRQTSPGDWRGVFERIASDLRREFRVD